MSRIGNAPIQVPAAAKLEIAEGSLHVKGPKGELSAPIPDGVQAEFENGVLSFKRVSVEDAP